jgi:hypothetical protein
MFSTFYTVLNFLTIIYLKEFVLAVVAALPSYMLKLAIIPEPTAPSAVLGVSPVPGVSPGRGY